MSLDSKPFQMKAIHLLLIVVLAVENALTLKTTDSPLPREDGRKFCSRNGYTCNSCNSLVHCEWNGSSFDETTVKECDPNEVCDETIPGCTANGFCRYSQFECLRTETPGEIRFPDPYSCQKYYGCVQHETYSEKIDYRCPEGRMYDVPTGSCKRIESTEGCKRNPVPLCLSTIQGGLLPSTDIAYQCHYTDVPVPTIYPELFIGRSLKTNSISSEIIQKIKASGSSTSKLREFKCPDLGNYPNVDNCTSYYECYGDLNGYLIYEEIHCDSGQYYDPIERDCFNGTCEAVVDYTTTAPPPTTQNSEPTTVHECKEGIPEPDPNDCHNYYDCEADPNTGVIVGTLKHCPPSQHFDKDELECVDGDCTTTKETTKPTFTTISTSPMATTPFPCKDLGDFPDPYDCHKYFECVGSADGSLIPDLHECDPGKYFDAGEGECIPGDCPTSTHSVPGSTVTVTSTTALAPIYCDSVHRFADESDCHSFYECFEDENGDLHGLHVKCGPNGRFDPAYPGCSKRGSCEFKCPYVGYFPNVDNCTSYYECYGDPIGGGLIYDVQSCTSGQYYDPIEQECLSGTCEAVDHYITTAPPPTTHNDKPTTVHECKEGIPEPDPNDCHNYYDCRADPNTGVIVGTLKHCPPSQHFDKDALECVDGDCTTTKETTKPTFTTISTTPMATTPFPCTDFGDFPDPYDCHKYFECYGSADGSLVPELHECPNGQFFDVGEGECIPGDCPTSTHSATESTVTMTSITTLAPIYCDAVDRFTDESDCHSFYECFEDENGDLHGLHVKCGPDGHFDPAKPGCSDGGCGATSTTMPTSTQSTISTSSPFTGTTSTYATKTTPFAFQCSTLGAFPDLLDCHYFWQCLGSIDGSIFGVRLMCPLKQYFEPDLRICVRGDC